MTDTVREVHGVRMLSLAEDGAPIADEAAATELVGRVFEHDATWVVVPVSRLDPRFFQLSTGLAGQVVQKLVNYRIKLAVIGDISGYLAASNPLRDYVRETNRGRDTWFLADLSELDGRLAAAGPGSAA